MVNITWSLTNNGTAIPSFVDHGGISNGATTTPVTVYLRHDGVNSITNVGFYIREFSGTYSGSTSAADDLAEVKSWGDGSSTASPATFGGFQNSFDSSTWPSSSAAPDVTDLAYTYRTGVGDSETNAITLPAIAGGGGAGIITAGNTATSFLTRVQVPASVTTVGIRQFDHTIVFNFTT